MVPDSINNPNHERFMRRCIELSWISAEEDGTPFGSVITKNNSIIAESSNKAQESITHHAEILALEKARDTLGTNDLSHCTLYTNCEPCPMCSFMIREFNISTVVFALASKAMGGYSKWPILQDTELCRFENVFKVIPTVVTGVLKDEAAEVFVKLGWTIHQDQ